MVLLGNKTMKVHRYSIDQLLDLRSSLSFIACVIDNINKHPDIAAIFALPEQAFRNPHTYSCLTATLLKQQRYTRPEVTTRRGESSSSSSQSMRSQGSWCLRQHPNFESRRTFDNQIQPLSAPTSVALHQAENFRRFYRAVVSPTHVRVTAGGRIVPNTRAMAPPSFEHNGDKHSSETPQQTNDIQPNDNSRATSSTAGDLQGSGISIGGQGLPGVHPVFPGSFLPHYGYFPQIAANMPGQNFGHPGHTQLSHQSANGNENSASSLQPVRVSHPAQFDPTRPYMMVNNQMCFPPTAFPQPLNGFPSGLVGNPPFSPPMLGGPPGHHMSHPMHGPVPFPMPPANFPVPMMQHPNGQLFSMISHQGHTQQASMPPMIPLQMASSEQTLQQHRDHLMMLEDHIARQSLQSVPYWATQRQILIGEIARMSNLHQSERNQSRSFQNEQALSQTSVDAGSSLDAPSNSNETRSPVVAFSNASTIVRSQESSVAYASSAAHTTQSTDSPTVQRATTAKPGPGSRLPATAAMAPPFQPRGCRLDLSAAEWEEFARVTDPRPGGRTSPPATPENTTQRLARLMSNCQTRWEDSAAGSSMISMPRSQTMPVPQLQTHTASLPAFRRSDTHPNGTAQMASIPYGPVSNPNNVGLQPYVRIHTQNHDPERSLAQKEYFGSSANSLSNHGTTRQGPRLDVGRQIIMHNSPVRGNYNNQTSFTTEDYLNKCQSMFENVSGESGVTRYASPWHSPMRNSVSHNSLDARARVDGPMSAFNLTTQSLASESATGAHSGTSGNIVKISRKLSADAQGLDVLANVFAETPQKYLGPDKEPATLQGPQRSLPVTFHSLPAEQLTSSARLLTRNDLGAIFASEDQVESTSAYEPTQTANPSMIRQHTSEDLAVIFASEGSKASAPKQVTTSASTRSLAHEDLGDIFASKRPNISASSYEADQAPTSPSIRPHTSEVLGTILALNEPYASASKQVTKPASTRSLPHEDLGDIFAFKEANSSASSYEAEQAQTHPSIRPHTSDDLGDIFASNEPQASTSYETVQASNAQLHTPALLGEIFASDSPIKNNQGTVTPTYMNGDDADDDKSIRSWARRAEHRSSTSTQSGNEKENLIVTPTTQDGSPKSKSSFGERVRSTSSAVQKNQILKNLLNLQPVAHSAVAAPAHVSSANAQGIVPPQNRGSAAASLAPAMVSMAATSKSSMVTSPRGIASPTTPENRSRVHLGQSFRRSPEHLGNEDYLECLKEIARHTSNKRLQADFK
ncbi:hypothetical protein SBOR_4889 [Sclerotinia borealis F-4128]|uniref:Uncharacterized protein n=1 Tax=Sclerotinia borealis (strain F-4128) TaxID=1432307 RepID=W9CD74_SCLBF|nr:hypothetical protein SBOR_4889 [Sclerotinia borealis F-4128]